VHSILGLISKISSKKRLNAFKKNKILGIVVLSLTLYKYCIKAIMALKISAKAIKKYVNDVNFKIYRKDIHITAKKKPTTLKIVG
jgi:hypothetical protein